MFSFLKTSPILNSNQSNLTYNSYWLKLFAIYMLLIFLLVKQ